MSGTATATWSSCRGGAFLKAPRRRGATRPPMPQPTSAGCASRVLSASPLSRPSCTLAVARRPLSPSLYCYRFSASPSRSKRLEVRRREGGRQQGGREGRQRTCGQRAGLSLPLHSLQSPREPSLRLPSTMSTKAKKRAAAAELGQRRGEESSQQREESIVTWLSRLSLHPSLPCHSFPSIRASSDRERGREGTRVRLALHCKVFAIAGSEKRSAWTSAKFLELPSTLMLRFSASNFAGRGAFLLH